MSLSISGRYGLAIHMRSGTIGPPPTTLSYLYRMQSSTQAEVPHLHRRFGFLQATALNMTNMIGIGPFITIPILMSAMNGGPQAMLGWLVAVLITIPDAMIWAELGAALPGSGGSYIYLKEGFGKTKWGRFMAFLFVWQFVLSGPLEIASGYIGISQYLKYIWPSLTPGQGHAVIAGTGVLAIFLLYRRIDFIGKITVTLWIGTLLTSLAVIATGAWHFDAKRAFDFPPGAFDFSVGFLMGLGAAARVGVYDYLGYYDVCYIGQEVKDPGRVLPRSIITSIVCVALIYIAINFSIIGVVSWREFVPASNPPAPVVSILMERIHGKKVALFFTLMVLWTAFGSVFALLLGYSRIPYAAALDGCFFKVVGKLHPTKGFPHVSLMVIGLIAILCSFLPLLTVIDALLVTRIVVQFIGQVAAVILLRKHRPEMHRPYKIWLYPITPAMALVGWMFIFGTTEAKLIFYGMLTLGLGGIFFLLWAFALKHWPFEEKGTDVKAHSS